MKSFQYLVGVLAVSTALPCTPASAFFHLWRFTEFFSNHDGSVQFIEMASLGPGETFAQGATITSSSTGKVFTFPNNLSGSTSNKRLLIATSGFGSLPGAVTPDFTLPSTSFFNPASDSLQLFAGAPIDTKAFTLLPTDGVMSRHYIANTGATFLATNNPTNFNGTSGSVNLPPPLTPTGDYNDNGEVDAADYVLWRETLNQTVTAGEEADGNKNGMIDAGDYDYWRERFGKIIPGTAFGNGVNAVPEPATIAIGLIGLGWLAVRRSRVATQFAGATWNAVGGLSDADEAPAVFTERIGGRSRLGSPSRWVR
jgi:hypothetical protein